MNLIISHSILLSFLLSCKKLIIKDNIGRLNTGETNGKHKKTSSKNYNNNFIIDEHSLCLFYQ